MNDAADALHPDHWSGLCSGFIQAECRVVAEAIRRVPPTITPAEVEADLQRIQALPKVWHDNDDQTLMKQLRGLASMLDRMGRLKSGGISSYASEHPEIAERLDAVRQKFWRAGIFIVPVGELEYWLSENFMKDGPSKERKQEWADEAASRIRQRPDKAGPVFDFIKQVAVFLAEREIQSP